MALEAATGTQVDLLAQELEGQEKLFQQGLTQVTRVLALQRELARLRGTTGQVEATIAENRGKIAEIEIELVRLISKLRGEAIAELRDLEFREIELRERRHSLKDQIGRLDLRAPVSGIVYGSTADTLRGGDPRRRADHVHRAEGRVADRAQPDRDRSTSTRCRSARRRCCASPPSTSAPRPSWSATSPRSRPTAYEDEQTGSATTAPTSASTTACSRSSPTWC